MADTLPAQTTAEYEAKFDLLMQEAVLMHEKMAVDRAAIEQLKAETQEIRDEMRTLLVGIEAEQQARIEQRIQAIAERDRRNLVLRLENACLRHKHGLPPRSGISIF